MLRRDIKLDRVDLLQEIHGGFLVRKQLEIRALNGQHNASNDKCLRWWIRGCFLSVDDSALARELQF